MSGKVIQNDEQYEKARLAVLKMAAELDDPLSGMTAVERDKKQGIYDRTTDLMMHYRRGGLVQQFPYLRDVYQQIGYHWQEHEQPGSPQAEDPAPLEIPKEPEEVPKQAEPSAGLSSWLDD
ncbi:hypothetical protein ACTHPF_26695 [Paenibacillus sp. SAF-054]|uniref:hypothetical protein n=1 Tax=unclassified Paenibacillus TaxID=185978 RepID=UPI003F7FD40B